MRAIGIYQRGRRRCQNRGSRSARGLREHSSMSSKGFKDPSRPGAFVDSPPAVRWEPFATLLWQLVPDWRSRCQAALQIYEEPLHLVYRPCALASLLEDAVPLTGEGW